MTPTLLGRWQTRLFLILVVAVSWTLVIVPFLPGGGTAASRYHAAFTILAVTLVLGLAWDAVYFGLQQFRWEKDWPALFGLLNGINEGFLVWLVVASRTLPGHTSIAGSAFLLHFTTVWLVTFVAVNGPMRVPFIRWRFKGGRLL